MDAISQQYSLETALEKAINAGVDMFIVANHYTDQTANVVLTIAKLIHDKIIKPERIDDAYTRITKLKSRVSLTRPFR